MMGNFAVFSLVCVAVPLLLIFYYWVISPRLHFKITAEGLVSQQGEDPGSVRWADIRSACLYREGGDYDWVLRTASGLFLIDEVTESSLRSRLLKAMSEHLPGFCADSAHGAIKARLDYWSWQRPSQCDCDPDVAVDAAAKLIRR